MVTLPLVSWWLEDPEFSSGLVHYLSCLCMLQLLERIATCYIMSVLFFSVFADFLAIFTSITILGDVPRPCKYLSNITTPSLYFSIWNYKIYHIWQFLVFIPVTGFQCHSVPVNSGDCSGEITRISKFRGRSEILAGKFHWNGTGIHRNDQNPAGICGASQFCILRACLATVPVHSF